MTGQPGAESETRIRASDRSRAAAHRGNEWHWLWEAYIAGLCAAAMAGVVLLNHRFPGNVPVAVTALAGIAAGVLAFGRRIMRLPESDWRALLFVGTALALWVVALCSSPVAVAAIPALYPLAFAALPLTAALVVITAINLTPLTLVLLSEGTGSPNIPMAIAITLIGVVAAPVIGTVIMTSMRQRQKLAAVVAELAASRAESARLSREAGTTAERARLAREIHDTLAQGFTSIVALAQAVQAELPHDPAGAARHVELIRTTARENLAEARVMVAELTPAALDDGSLAAAIRRLCDNLAAESGIAIDVRIDPAVPQLGMAVDVVLLRAAQEALANVRRHAAADAVRVDLAGCGDRVRLTLSDNGVGLPDDHLEGFGLRGMRARVTQVGGKLSLTSLPQGGVTVEVEVPT